MQWAKWKPHSYHKKILPSWFSGTNQYYSRDLSLLLTHKPIFTTFIINPTLLLEINEKKKKFLLLELLVICFCILSAVTWITIDKPYMTIHQPPCNDGLLFAGANNWTEVFNYREKKPSSCKYPSSSDAGRQENSLCLRPQCILVGIKPSDNSIIT